MPESEDAEHYNRLGSSLYRDGRYEEAEACYRAALQSSPDWAIAWTNLGLVRMALGSLEAAEQCHREALQRDPELADAHSNLGLVHYRLGRVAESENCFRGGIRLRPDHAGARLNLAVALQALGRLDQAETCYREALCLGADPAQTYNNLSVLLRERSQVAQAEACSRKALCLQPDLADARVNLAMALMVTGRWTEAWPLYEFRWQVGDLKAERRDFPQPQWIGQESVEGRVILLHAEQGFGDTLQFCRYAPLLAQQGARIVLEVQPPLVRLMATLSGVEIVVARGDALPPFDLHCPLMSLPYAFGTTVETVPAAVPYLAPDPAQVAFWRAALDGLVSRRSTPFRVGLAWAGSSRTWLPHAAALDRRRSMRLADMAPLAAVPGCSFVSLQLGPPARQLRAPPPELLVHDFADQLRDFTDTAALVENLDLVISVDTAVAHLAGALGKPVWLLNRSDTCWRWLLDRDDSSWYSGLRQFRNSASGAWIEVMQRVALALRQWTESA